MQDPVNLKTNCDVPALWLEHKEALKHFIYKRVKDHNTTNDILQEVLLKVYKFCLSKSGVRNVRSWLFQIANNTIIDDIRKKQHVIHAAEIPEITDNNEDSAYKDAVDFILPMIKLLPFEYAEPLRLSDIVGIKQSEIAKQLDLELSATKSRIQRARKMLKDVFIECCIMEIGTDGKLISFDIKEGCRPLQEHKKNPKSY